MNQNTKKALNKAQNTVYRLLKFRLRSEQEIRAKLKLKKFDADVIEAAIEWCKKYDLIDDRLFTQKWISSRLAKPFGVNRIRFELKDKGIDPKVIQEELNSATSEYSELTAVEELMQHRLTKYKDIEPLKKKQRLYGYLSRRGFSQDSIRKALNKL